MPPYLVYYINNRYDRFEFRAGNRDTASRAGRVDDLAVADINPYMADGVAGAAVENQVAGLDIRVTDRTSFPRLGAGRMAQGDTEFTHDPHRKAGAVDTAR